MPKRGFRRPRAHGESRQSQVLIASPAMPSSNFFESSFRVRYTETDPGLRLAPVPLFNLFQETAIRASSAVGRGPRSLLAKGLGWFLLRFRLEVREMPTLDQEIIVRTWSSGIDKILASREFELRAKGGRILAIATSVWVIIDLARRRPVRVPAWVSEPYASQPNRLLGDDPLDDPAAGESARFENAEELDPRARAFALRLDDLDSNRHVGSATFVAACLQALPHELSIGGILDSLAIDFKKEASFSDQLRIEATPEGRSSEPKTFRHRISRQGDVLALARSSWGPAAG